MIDPLAGPWTVRRNRKRGRRRIEKKSLFAGGRPASRDRYPERRKLDGDQNPGPDLQMIARADASYGLAGASAGGMTSTITAPTVTSEAQERPTPPAADKSLTGGSGHLAEIDLRDKLARRGPASKRSVPSVPAPRRPARQRRYSAKVAVPVLLGLVVVAVVLVGVIIKLAGLGFNTATGTTALTSPLADPAPAEAGGLPRHYQPEQNLSTIELIDDFTRRFSAVSRSYSGHPSALYREPGAIDPETDQPGWVMYLGYNASSDLGAPAATVKKLMAALIQTTAPNASWPANPGELGGSARCAITNMRGTTVTFCAWATDRTYGALMSPTSDTRGQELATLMPLMRLDLQS